MTNHRGRRTTLFLTLPGVMLVGGCVLSDTLQTFVQDFILQLIQAAVL